MSHVRGDQEPRWRMKALGYTWPLSPLQKQI